LDVGIEEAMGSAFCITPSQVINERVKLVIGVRNNRFDGPEGRGQREKDFRLDKKVGALKRPGLEKPTL